MATEYERIDKLMKALAGLISPHIECEDTDTDDIEYMIDEVNDRIDSIESDFLQKDDLSDSLPDNLITSDNWESKTGIYTYPVWLYRVAIVITADMMATWDGSEPWIAENSYNLFLDAPCYI